MELQWWDCLCKNNLEHLSNSLPASFRAWGVSMDQYNWPE